MSVHPLRVLQARAEARALLYACCEYDDVEQAVDPLFAYAIESGIAAEFGMDAVKSIIKQAFPDVS
jgi:hypothetical protein